MEHAFTLSTMSPQANPNAAGVQLPGFFVLGELRSGQGYFDLG